MPQQGLKVNIHRPKWARMCRPIAKDRTERWENRVLGLRFWDRGGFLFYFLFLCL